MWVMQYRDFRWRAGKRLAVVCSPIYPFPLSISLWVQMLSVRLVWFPRRDNDKMLVSDSTTRLFIFFSCVLSKTTICVVNPYLKNVPSVPKKTYRRMLGMVYKLGQFFGLAGPFTATSL
jgi:hypothetical protein